MEKQPKPVKIGQKA